VKSEEQWLLAKSAAKAKGNRKFKYCMSEDPTTLSKWEGAMRGNGWSLKRGGVAADTADAV